MKLEQLFHEIIIIITNLILIDLIFKRTSVVELSMLINKELNCYYYYNYYYFILVLLLLFECCVSTRISKN
jgi:hypothetical protein